MIDRVVVDTNVVSYFLRPGDTRAAAYAPHLRGKAQSVAFVTVGELHRWQVLCGWGPAYVNRLERVLAGLVIVHSDDALCRQWGELTAAVQQAGTPMAEADAWVAATALELGVPLVTHNRRHFSRVAGLTVISEA